MFKLKLLHVVYLWLIYDQEITQFTKFPRKRNCLYIREFVLDFSYTFMSCINISPEGPGNKVYLSFCKHSLTLLRH